MSVIETAIKNNESKCRLTLVPAAGGNYLSDSEKVVNVKLTALKIASKTAKVTASYNTATEEVVITYNGQVLKQPADGAVGSGDYKVVKKSESMVKISAVKQGVYQGSRTFKEDALTIVK